MSKFGCSNSDSKSELCDDRCDVRHNSKCEKNIDLKIIVTNSKIFKNVVMKKTVKMV